MCHSTPFPTCVPEAFLLVLALGACLPTLGTMATLLLLLLLLPPPPLPLAALAQVVVTLRRPNLSTLPLKPGSPTTPAVSPTLLPLIHFHWVLSIVSQSDSYGRGAWGSLLGCHSLQTLGASNRNRPFTGGNTSPLEPALAKMTAALPVFALVHQRTPSWA